MALRWLLCVFLIGIYSENLPDIVCYFRLSKKLLSLPLGEVARASGSERVCIFFENPKGIEYLLCKYSIPPQSCCSHDSSPRGRAKALRAKQVFQHAGVCCPDWQHTFCVNGGCYVGKGQWTIPYKGVSMAACSSLLHIYTTVEGLWKILTFYPRKTGFSHAPKDDTRHQTAQCWLFSFSVPKYAKAARKNCAFMLDILGRYR